MFVVSERGRGRKIVSKQNLENTFSTLSISLEGNAHLPNPIPLPHGFRQIDR
jgi:hypothetical protein